MKKPNVQIASLFLLAAFLLLAGTVSAQKTNTWKGGKPGHPNAWNCAQNWSLNTVPNEFQDVMIPDVSSGFNQYPIIDDTENTVRSLTISANAQLTILPTGKLLVIGFEDGTGLINQGKIFGINYLYLEYNINKDTAGIVAQRQ
jgi:hypothetical protein